MKKPWQIKATPPNQAGTCGAGTGSAAAGAEAGEEAASEISETASEHQEKWWDFAA